MTRRKVELLPEAAFLGHEPPDLIEHHVTLVAKHDRH
jgi:hypothetical protein